MRKFILMALASLGLALAVPSSGSAAPLSPDQIRAAVQETSGVETVAHCRRTSWGGCRRYYRYYARPRYRVYRYYYRPRYRRVYRVW